MILSEAGRDLIKSFESLRLTSYRDISGVWTIGWGHTGSDVGPGMTWTLELADAMLVQDAGVAERAVNSMVAVPLTQGEFDALVSFVFNCGAGAFLSSTMLRLLNDGDYDGAADQFERWDKDKTGKVVAGLLRRRVAEEDEFKGGLA